MNRKELEKEARIKDIMEAALKLFAEKDFHEVTVDEIAERVGLSKGTLYLYFENKESLFYSIIIDKTKELFGRLKSSIEKDAPFIKSLNCFMETYLSFFQEHVSFFKLVHSDKNLMAIEQHDKLHQLAMDALVSYFNLISELVKKGQNENVLKKTNVFSITKMLQGMLNSFTFSWIFMGGVGSLVDEAPTIGDLFLNGAKQS